MASNEDVLKALKGIATKGDQDAAFSMIEGLKQKLYDIENKYNPPSINVDLSKVDDKIKEIKDKVDKSSSDNLKGLEGLYITLNKVIKEISDIKIPAPNKEVDLSNIENTLKEIKDEIDYVFTEIDEHAKVIVLMFKAIERIEKGDSEYSKTLNNYIKMIKLGLNQILDEKEEDEKRYKKEKKVIKVESFKLDNFHVGDKIEIYVEFSEEVEGKDISLKLRDVEEGTKFEFNTTGVMFGASLIMESILTKAMRDAPHKYELVVDNKILSKGKVNILGRL